VDLYALATEVGTALNTVVPAPRVYPYGAPKIEASGAAAVVTMPEEYTAAGYGRGARHVSGLGVLLCVRYTESGRPSRSSLKSLYGYLAETGAASIVKAVEDFAYTACVPGTMVWRRTSFDVVTIGGNEYLSALLEFDADGVAT
jgi:hypothetical protein